MCYSFHLQQCCCTVFLVLWYLHLPACLCISHEPKRWLVVCIWNWYYHHHARSLLKLQCQCGSGRGGRRGYTPNLTGNCVVSAHTPREHTSLGVCRLLTFKESGPLIFFVLVAKTIKTGRKEVVAAHKRKNPSEQLKTHPSVHWQRWNESCMSIMLTRYYSIPCAYVQFSLCYSSPTSYFLSKALLSAPAFKIN